MSEISIVCDRPHALVDGIVTVASFVPWDSPVSEFDPAIPVDPAPKWRMRYWEDRPDVRAKLPAGDAHLLDESDVVISDLGWWGMHGVKDHEGHKWPVQQERVAAQAARLRYTFTCNRHPFYEMSTPEIRSDRLDELLDAISLSGLQELTLGLIDEYLRKTRCGNRRR